MRRRPLSLNPPRHYSLRDAYRRRVWRTPACAIGAELIAVGGSVWLGGFLLDEGGVSAMGAVAVSAGWVLAIVASLAANLRRVHLIRSAPAVEARLERPRRVLLLHQMFSAERRRTFVVPYVYEAPDGVEHRGRAWVCGCARQALRTGDIELALVDPEHPRRSLLFRLGVMRRP